MSSHFIYFLGDIRKTAFLKVSENSKKQMLLVELFCSNSSCPMYYYNYTQNEIHRKGFLWEILRTFKTTSKHLRWITLK